MPLHVVLTVHRAARKLLTNLKFKRGGGTGKGGAHKFSMRQIAGNLGGSGDSSKGSNSRPTHGGEMSTVEAMRRSPSPVLSKLNI